MKNDFLDIFRHAIVYGIGKSSEKIAGFLLLPLYTRILTPDDYGILSLIKILIGACGHVFLLGTSSSLFRFYKTSNDENNNKDACVSSLILVTSFSFLTITLSLPYLEDISLIIFKDIKYSNYILIGLLIGAFSSISGIPMSILRVEGNSFLYVTNNIVKMFFRIGLGFIFVVILERAALGALESILITSSLFCIYLLLHRLLKTGFGFDIRLALKILKYGAPLIFSGLGGMIFQSADKYFLNEYTDLNQVGIYSVGFMIGSSFLILVIAFKNAWVPIMFKYSEREDAGLFYGQVLTYYLAVMGFIWIIITLFSKEITLLMVSKEFFKSHIIIPPISLAFIFLGAGSIVSAGIYTKDHTSDEFILFPISIGFCLLANYLLVKNLGMLGSALAVTSSYLFNSILYGLRSMKYLKIIYQWSIIIRIILIYSTTILIIYLFQTNNLIIDISIKSFLLFLIFLIISKSKYFFSLEFKIILSKLNFNG